MRRLFFFVNLLVIPLLSGWVVYRRLATPPTDVGPFDYFKLALQWPPSICSHGVPEECPNNFTIHGLWPDNFTGPFQEFCNNRSRYIRMRGRLLEQMQSNWPDIINHRDQSYWEYQWSKYGTCALLSVRQVQYFNLALNGKDRYNFLGYFGSQGITPGPSSHYPDSLIRKKVKSLTSKSPDLYCEEHIDEHEEKRLTLHEVRYCFGPNGEIDCPAKRSSRSCSGDIYFPSEEHLFHFS
ncbi:hypothetical protein RHSIM_Rhsim09G0141400 [Rhododendron simsii]|uniref:Uncharacterized protein n=1 Tax=Rhododendron simsii TaxID=118357 RepID=A0A834GJK5_RHOSS|nr:hypothetical protein RHSIM_Rhsim09G0141400 [Rhododendron simsii]